jgi:hypothetical protein
MISLFLMILMMWFLVLPVLSLAQDDSENMKIVREKIFADRKLFVAANMELTDAEGKAFWPVYEAYLKDMTELNGKGAAIIEDYARNFQSMTDEKAKSLLDDYLAFEAERLKLQRDYLPKFRKIIPEVKVTRYYQIENKIRAVVNYGLAAEIPLVE